MITGKRRSMATVAALCIAGFSFGFAAPAFAADEPSPAVAVTTSPSPSPSESVPSGYPPGAPTDIKWTKVTATSVKLAWSKAAAAPGEQDPDYYVVQAVKDGEKLADKKVTGTSLTYKGIDPNTVLTVSVTAVNQFAASAVVDGPKWTQPAVAPDAPGSVTIASVTATGIKVGWTAPDDDGGAAVTAYLVRLFQGDDIYYEQTLDVVSTSDSFTSLMPGQVYHVEVVAMNKAGKSKAAVSREVTLAKPTQAVTPTATPTRTVVVTPPPVVSTPSPTDTRIQQDIDQVRERQAQLEAQQQAAVTWTVIGVLLVLLAGAVTGFIFVMRYNRKVAAYNREHGFKS